MFDFSLKRVGSAWGRFLDRYPKSESGFEPELPAEAFGVVPSQQVALPAAHALSLGDYAVLLLDNGSLAPQVTIELRGLASRLAAKIVAPVHPVSLLHSSAIPAADLDGLPAENFEPALARRLAEGQSNYLVVPLFFGPTQSLTSLLPESVAKLKYKYPDLRVVVAPPLFDQDDIRLARMLADGVRALPRTPRRIIVVDHGSPNAEVTAVRNALGRQLQSIMDEDAVVAVASMERRPEREYDFNDPLLADLLNQPGWNTGEVAIALQFLLPGRHAGPDGDVARICRDAETRNPGLSTRLTAPLGSHPLLVQILAERCRSTLPSV